MEPGGSAFPSGDVIVVVVVVVAVVVNRFVDWGQVEISKSLRRKRKQCLVPIDF